MKLRRLSWLILVAILVLVLAACGGGGGDGDGSDGDGDSGDGGGNLSRQNYDFNGLSFDYPGGWVVDYVTEGQVAVANSQEAMDALENQTDGGPSSGQFSLMITFFAAEEMGLTEDVSLAAVLEMFLGFAVDEDTPNFSVPLEETVGGKNTIRVEGSDENVQAVMIVIDFDNTYAFVTGATTLGELGDFNDEINAIIGSMSYTAP